ncbi:MAG: cytochrome c peroxidase [Planctomycetota bacterium]
MADKHTPEGTHPAGEHHDPYDVHPHVVPMPLLIAVIGSLLVLTLLTVAASWIDMGGANVPVAMFIATVKGTLVALFFMHLRWDKPFNSIVLVTSLGMLALFLTIATFDTSEYQSIIDPTYAETRMQDARAQLAAKIAGHEVKGDELLNTLYPREHAEGEHAGAGEADSKALEVAIVAKNIFGPLPQEAAAPPDNPTTAAKVALGKQLYFDGRLSVNDKISCNSCHDLATYGVDNKPTSLGHDGKNGARNSPTVYNAALNATQFWDGRAASLEEQAKGPVLNPVEMGMPSAEGVVQKLKAIKGYQQPFQEAFPGQPDPITYDNVARAIAAFERTLLTPGPLDKFMGGDHAALSKEAQEGLLAFQAVGCTQCHTGPNLGGTVFKKLGEAVPYPTKDLGRFEVTKAEGDKFFFKVPGLRNVEKTGPYFHDGSIATLDEAVRLMAKHQLNKELTPEQVKQISAFLNALTGPLSPAVTAAPALPQ